MKPLKLSVSGVRGIVGQAITPELIINFASAFGTMVLAGPVLVGRDSRNSSPMLTDGVISALLATGHEVIDLGLCPTPITQFLVKNKGARGAVSVTAGHNPAPWNALNFINSQGTYLNEFQGQELLDIYHLGRFKQLALKKTPKIIRELNPEEPYLEWLLGRLDLPPIKRAKFRIVVDPTNGAASKLIDKLFDLLGVQLIAINNEGNGYFPHDPEPRPRNAIEVSSLVKITTADIGFLLNSDASRLSLVSEDGETLSEEYTLPLIARYYLKKQPGPVVTNLSTSMMIDQVAREQNLPVIRTRVGQSAIIQAMLEEKASLAGEGSGGLAFDYFQPAFDALVTMALYLEMMAVEGEKLSTLVKRLPRYHIVKDSLVCPAYRLHTLVAEVKKLYKGLEINQLDGLRLEKKDLWVHVRASTTEPLIRVIAESTSQHRAQMEVDRIMAYLRRLTA